MFWKLEPRLYPPHLRPSIRRGRGIGKGLEYRSWFTVRDVPSRGTPFKIAGIFINRVFHLLSEQEATYFFLIERNPKVVDIRENWPIMHLDWTLEACSRLGVRHPYKDGHLLPFTLDFLITESHDGKLKERAASVKTPGDAANPGIRRRLNVERDWCRERAGIPWTLVDTSAFVDRILLSTLTFMRAWFGHRYEPDAEREGRFQKHFSFAYVRNVPLKTLIRRVRP